MKKFLIINYILIFTIIAVTSTACVRNEGSKKTNSYDSVQIDKVGKTPNCSAQNVLNDVGSIYKNNSDIPWLNYNTEEHKKSSATEYNTQVKNIEEVNYNEESDSYVCKGKLVLTSIEPDVGIMYKYEKPSPDVYSSVYFAEMIQYDINYFVSGGEKDTIVKVEWKNPPEMIGLDVAGD